MKVILRITKRLTHAVEQEFIGVPAVYYDLSVLSELANADGKHARLAFPGVLQSATEQTLAMQEAKALAHLARFGFEVEVQTR